MTSSVSTTESGQLTTENTTIIPWSAMTKQGREEIYRLLDTYLEEGCEDGK